MKITILFATHNGSYTLPLMMESLLQTHLPPKSELEIIAVCNACTDDSEKILSSFSNLLNIKILVQKAPGKNKALNHGIKSATGDLIIVTDDDIIADPYWLINYKKMYIKYPESSIFGGKILPHWITLPPPELVKAIPCSMAYALTSDLDYKNGVISHEKLYGPNMAVKKEVFESGHLFDESVGPNSSESAYRMGSETEFLLRCKKHGYDAVYSSDCVVHHIIRPWQLKANWLYNRAFRGGLSTFAKAYEEDKEKLQKVATILGYPRWCIVKKIKICSLLLLNKVTFRKLKTSCYYKSIWKLGNINGYVASFKRFTDTSITP